jgi:acetyl-CoA carboxylase carboxyltransferase component
LYPAEDLYGILPATFRETYDMREVIARVVDASEFREFKPRYGSSLVAGFARIHGYPLGILANNGVLFSESALKGTHFIEYASRGASALISANITGFMVGKDYEAGGIAKDGAKLVHAVATTRSAQVDVLLGGSFGAGQFGWLARHSIRNSVDVALCKDQCNGGEQAANVLLT